MGSRRVRVEPDLRFTGQVLFGAQAFFGTGAYSATLLLDKLDISAWGLPLGGVAAVILALPLDGYLFGCGSLLRLGLSGLGRDTVHVATIWESLTEGMVGILVMQLWVSKLRTTT